MMKAQSTTTTAAPPSQKSAFPLRKATYVTIDKLVRSQYDFDDKKLNDELFRIRSETGETALQQEPQPQVKTEQEPPTVEQLSLTPKETNHAWTTNDTANDDDDNNNNNNSPSTSPQVLPPNSFKFHTASNRLQPPRDGFNLCLLVDQVDIVVNKIRVDGSRVLVAEVLVGDGTGCMSLRARDEQIRVLEEICKKREDGMNVVVLRNCTVELHQRKFLRLAVSKWGKMTAYPDGIESTPDPPLTINEERNYSLVDLNMVATAKENILPSQSSNQNKQQQQQQQHHHKLNQGRGHNFEDRRSPSYHQRGSNRKYQNQRRQQQQQISMYSPPPGPPRGYYSQQYYPSYSGDCNSVYSYQSHSTERNSPPTPHGQHWQHPYPTDYNHRQQQQQQQHLIYQQYELHQRHAHQMQMLQETQRRLMAVEQQRMGAHPQGVAVGGGAIVMTESHESSNVENHEYALPSTVAMAPPMPGEAFAPMPGVGVAMGYPYGSPVSSPMRSMGQEQKQQKQQQSSSEEQASTTTAAAVVSPPASPLRFGPVPPSGYGDPLLYFDQSSIPLTGMQEPDPSTNDEENDENIQF